MAAQDDRQRTAYTRYNEHDVKTPTQINTIIKIIVEDCCNGEDDDELVDVEVVVNVKGYDKSSH